VFQMRAQFLLCANSLRPNQIQNSFLSLSLQHLPPDQASFPVV